MNDDRPLILLGAGGHAKVSLALALACGRRVVGVCAPELAAAGFPTWRDLPVLGDDAALERLDPDTTGLLNGIGQLVGSQSRQDVFQRLRGRGFRFPALVHPSAWVDGSCRLEEGVQIMAGAVLQPDVRIGENCIINTRAGIDHDCCIGNHVHIAPGATLCGAVRVADGAFVGSGATVIQGLTIGAGAVVAAGAVLVRDLAAGQRHLNRVGAGSPRAAEEKRT